MGIRSCVSRKGEYSDRKAEVWSGGSVRFVKACMRADRRRGGRGGMVIVRGGWTILFVSTCSGVLLVGVSSGVLLDGVLFGVTVFEDGTLLLLDASTLCVELSPAGGSLEGGVVVVGQVVGGEYVGTGKEVLWKAG